MWGRRLLIAAGVVLGTWLVLASAFLALAAIDLKAGKDAVDRARATSGPGDLADGRPLPDLRQARARFDRAHRRVTNLVLWPTRAVPVLGRQLRSVSALSATAATVADVGVDAVSEARRVLDLPHEAGPDRVELVRRLGRLATGTDARLTHLDYGPRQGLVSPLAHARNDLARQLFDLRRGLSDGTRGARAAADLLAGPRRYLVFAANNAEMRAGSGMFLSVGVLETNDGAVHLGPMKSVGEYPVPPGAVAIDDRDLAARWAWVGPNVEWRNLMTSPRFDAAAPLAARMWAATGNGPVDGVIAIDPVALQGVLLATGPVTSEGQTVGADTVVEQLLHGQYQSYPVDRYPTAEELQGRRDRSGSIARAAFDALDAGGWKPSALADGLSTAARGRHLLAWSSRQVEEDGWRAAKVDGSLPGDSLLVALLNRGGNKLDRFVTAEANLDLRPAGDHTDAALQIVLRNDVPPGEPRYVAGPHPESGVGEGVYLGMLTVTLPGSARDGRFDGVAHLNVAGGDGPTRVIGFQFSLGRGKQHRVIARFRLPGRAGAVHVEPSGRVPPITWRSGEKEWRDDASYLLGW